MNVAEKVPDTFSPPDRSDGAILAEASIWGVAWMDDNGDHEMCLDVGRRRGFFRRWFA